MVPISAVGQPAHNTRHTTIRDAQTNILERYKTITNSSTSTANIENKHCSIAKCESESDAPKKRQDGRKFGALLIANMKHAKLVTMYDIRKKIELNDAIWLNEGTKMTPTIIMNVTSSARRGSSYGPLPVTDAHRAMSTTDTRNGPTNE